MRPRTTRPATTAAMTTTMGCAAAPDLVPDEDEAAEPVVDEGDDPSLGDRLVEEGEESPVAAASDFMTPPSEGGWLVSGEDWTWWWKTYWVP
jgi:hypothetical protein